LPLAKTSAPQAPSQAS